MLDFDDYLDDWRITTHSAHYAGPYGDWTADDAIAQLIREGEADGPSSDFQDEVLDLMIDDALLLLSRPVRHVLTPEASAPWDRRITAASI